MIYVAFTTLQEAVTLVRFKQLNVLTERFQLSLLLEVLAVEGCIITIDAMGTQKEISSTIIERGAAYVLALKV